MNEELSEIPQLSRHSQAALRALAEAKARRDAEKAEAAKEVGGRGGLDPVRYGDW